MTNNGVGFELWHLKLAIKENKMLISQLMLLPSLILLYVVKCVKNNLKHHG